MFSLRIYIKKGLLDAVGKLSEYQIILNSAGWLEKGVLTEDDLAEIQTALEARENDALVEGPEQEKSGNKAIEELNANPDPDASEENPAE